MSALHLIFLLFLHTYALCMFYLDVEPIGINCQFSTQFACGYNYGAEWYFDTYGGM